MKPAEEDALIYDACEPMQTIYSHKSREAIRLAIRAAYAQGREDAAKVCEAASIDDPNYIIAAAIRKGEE